MRLPLRFAPWFLACALGGCASGPPSPELAARWERADLVRIERRLQRSPQRLRDTALEQWLVEQLLRVDPEHGAGLRLYLLDLAAPQIDLIGREVLRLRLGLLLELQSEGELLFALAHEVAHRDLGHVEARRAPGWNPDEGEAAADARAVATLLRLGYAPDHGIRFLRRIRERTTAAPARAQLDDRIRALERADSPSHQGSAAADPRFLSLLAPYRRR